MSEVLVITWTDNVLELRQIPSEDIWQTYPPIRSVPVDRPTRESRFSHPESGGKLADALSDLLFEVDVVVPLWFLVPTNWAIHFKIPKFSGDDIELIQKQLHWEVRERLLGNEEHYRFIALDMKPDYYDIFVIRELVIKHISNAAKEAGVDLTCIGREPYLNQQYSFEIPLDFREAINIAPPIVSVLGSKQGVSPAIAAAVIAFSLALVGGYMFFSKSEGEISPKPKVSSFAKKATTPAKKPTTEVIIPKTDTLTQKIEQAATPISNTATKHFSKFVSTLPANTKINLVSLSNAELRIELVNLSSPDGFVQNVKKYSPLSSIQVAGKYSDNAGTITVLRAAEATLSNGSQPINNDKWQEKAKSCGMKVSGRRATGSFEQAINLVDDLWVNSEGYSKILFAPEKENWVVVVQ